MYVNISDEKAREILAQKGINLEGKNLSNVSMGDSMSTNADSVLSTMALADCVRFNCIFRGILVFSPY